MLSLSARRTHLVAALIVSTGLSAAIAQERSRQDLESAPAPLTVQDIAGLTTISAVTLSPDARWVAWVATSVDWQKGIYNPDLWLAPTDASEAPHQITFDESSDGSPAFSPDSESLAFLSARSGTSQVWLLSLSAGEARQITHAPTSVSEFELLPDGQSLVFIRPEETPSEWTKKVENKNDARVLGDWYPYGHLWRQSLLGAAEPERLTNGPFDYESIAVSPDGKSFALGRRPTPRVPDGFNADLVLLTPGQEPRVLVDWQGGDSAPEFSPDGKTLSFMTGDGVVDWAGESHIAVVAVDGGEPRVVSREYNRSPRFYEWGPDGKTFFFHGPYETTGQLYSLDLETGALRDLSKTEGVITSGDFAPEQDRVAFAWESLTEPPEVYVSRLDSFEPERLSHHNEALRDRALGETRILRWKNPEDGLEIEGLLTLPVGYEASQGRVPLLTFAHGGPASFFDQGFLGYLYYCYPTHVFAARGYAVLRPNPRGSGAYGEPFKRANRSDWGGLDYVDIQAGIDLVIEQGIADPERLGFMGWSYGGFMTSWTITQTDRFKAASIGAPVTDLFSFQGSADIPGFIPSYFEGLPYTNQERYRAHNPMSHVQNVKTPALIQHGEADERVPLFQGQIYHQALLDMGIPTEMVIYPRTPHVPLEPRLRVDTMLRNLWWFDKWIGGDERSFEEYRSSLDS